MNLKKTIPLAIVLSGLLVVGLYITKKYSAVTKEEGSHLDNFYVQNLSSDEPEFYKKSDVLGKTFVLHIWASWCGVCTSETPVIESLWGKLKTSQKVQFLAVATSDNLSEIKKTRKFKEKLFPLGFDTKENLGESMDIDHLPYTIVFNPDGEMTHKYNGRLTQEEINHILSYM